MREPIKDFYGRVLGWLEDQGLYDSYQPTALAYQEFVNGTM